MFSRTCLLRSESVASKITFEIILCLAPTPQLKHPSRRFPFLCRGLTSTDSDVPCQKIEAVSAQKVKHVSARQGAHITARKTAVCGGMSEHWFRAALWVPERDEGHTLTLAVRSCCSSCREMHAPGRTSRGADRCVVVSVTLAWSIFKTYIFAFKAVTYTRYMYYIHSLYTHCSSH